MKALIAYCVAIGALFLNPTTMIGGDSFVWLPVTPADWSITADSSKGIRNAIMIFTKLMEDDEDWLDKECYLTIYNRIKIFNVEGKKYGDVSIPVLDDEQEIEEVYGRTVFPDGKEILLQKADIREKEIFESDGTKVKQKSFSLPGLTNDCIIEYHIKYLLPSPNTLWLIQKEIAVSDAEYRWKFYRGADLGYGVYESIRNDYTPNYLWLNSKKPGIVEQLPNIKEPEEVRFSIQNVPAFEAEPYSLSEFSLLTQLRLYYGKASAPGAYWGELSEAILKQLEQFTKNNDRSKEMSATFGTGDSVEKKIKTCYDWLQSNIKNVAYADPKEEYDTNEDVDDVLKRKYGTGADINKVFYDMLREMNIPAKMVYTIDRDRGLFVTDAKYWQFDGTMVAVNVGQSGYRFYSPGNFFLPSTQVSRYNEGTTAMMVGDQNQQFVVLPFSSPDLNRQHRTYNVSINDNFKLEGKLSVQFKGHQARGMRLLTNNTDEADQTEKLKKELKEQFPNAEIDSILATGLTDHGSAVTLSCHINLDNIHQEVGNRLIIQPFSFFSTIDNPFHNEQRHYPILFNYAFDLSESMLIQLPEGYSVESAPKDTSFVTKAGRCEFKTSLFGQTLSLQRMFRLSTPFWTAANYDIVRQLFQTRQGLDVLAIVLKKE